MSTEKDKPARAERLAFFLLKAVNKAIRIYDLIADGDHIALALSGGKDSRCLSYLLRRRQEFARERYTLTAVHVLPSADAPCTGLEDPGELRAWVQDLGIGFVEATMEAASGTPTRRAQSPCFYCAWRRRKALFTKAQELGCNKLAFGHHADDVAATTLLNLFYQGRLESMEPKKSLFQGVLTLIRPLYLVPEKDITPLARALEIPVGRHSCAARVTSKRRTMERIIHMVEEDYPKAKISLLRAVERAVVSRQMPVSTGGCDQDTQSKTKGGIT
jgi:tRNA 2-thiocytidine biosynthesis protein TtcA